MSEVSFLNVSSKYRMMNEWPSELRSYIQNWNNPGSNPTRCSAGLWDPSLS